MPPEILALLLGAILAIAFLYSSVGHAGASGYIAVMTLFSLAPEVIRPTALVLNVLVASIGTWQFWRAGHFSWRLFWPFALLAAPFAFLGGYLSLPPRAFQILIGLVLLCSAAWLVMRPPPDEVRRSPSLPAALGVGAGLGLLAGLTGTGGGIFLTPFLLLMRWATARTAAAVSAFFILVNSVSGLLGNLTSTREIPPLVVAMAIVAMAGGWLGSRLGSGHFRPDTIKRLLAAVLAIAGAKLILT